MTDFVIVMILGVAVVACLAMTWLEGSEDRDEVRGRSIIDAVEVR